MNPCPDKTYIPTWKKCLSYIADIEIERRESPISGQLTVVLRRGRYQLNSKKAVYSYEERYDNFGSLFADKLDFEQLSGTKVLILGLGMASIPIILDRIKPGKWDFTAVEIDEEVCLLASKYGMPKIVSPIQIHLADATQYIANCIQTFDIVCVDLFVDDKIPERFLQNDFLIDVSHTLNPGGVVIYNTLAYTQKDRKNSNEFFTSYFLKIFPRAKLIETHRNYMLVSRGDVFN